MGIMRRRARQSRTAETQGIDSGMTDKTIKKRHPPKLMSRAEQKALAEQHEASRLGRVAHHREKNEADCPYAEGDPLRQLWLAGLAEAKNKPLRVDMPSARAKGDRAFRDGLKPEECPLPSRSPERSEWMAAYEATRLQHEKDEDKRYR
jgi:hypothetical protein